MKIILLIIVSFSFSLSSDVLIDSETELMWQDNPAVQYTKKDWEGALNFCNKLHLDGYSDWRLPNIKELGTVVGSSPRHMDMKLEFKHVGGSGYYWSSSADPENEEFAWMMNFKRSYKYINYKTYERYVRCVRNQTINSN